MPERCQLRETTAVSVFPNEVDLIVMRGTESKAEMDFDIAACRLSAFPENLSTRRWTFKLLEMMKSDKMTLEV